VPTAGGPSVCLIGQSASSLAWRRAARVAGKVDPAIPPIRHADRRVGVARTASLLYRACVRGHVFVSYDPTSHEYVGRLVSWLEQQGYEVAEGDRKAIDTCTALILVTQRRRLARRGS
jgi:hypothetical protein